MLQLDLGCYALRLCLIYRLDESGRIDTGSDRRLKPAHSSFGIVETLLRGVPAAINAREAVRLATVLSRLSSLNNCASHSLSGPTRAASGR